MSQTTAITEPHAAVTPHLPRPADLLMSLIVSLLAPMFLSLAGGNVTYARMAATETVNAYRSRNHADLIAIAQIIGFGLAALGSLSLSMADDLSVSLTLRLRSNATALNRAAEQNRRAYEASLKDDRAPQTAEPSHDFLKDRDSAPAAPQAAAVALASMNEEPQPAIPAPGSAQTPAASPKAEEKRHQAMWAIAMVKEASEITASIPNLPPAERNAASIRAAALSSTANQLLTGVEAHQSATTLGTRG